MGNALPQTGQVLCPVAGLPRQVWQVSCKVNGMLAGTATDLEHGAAARKHVGQDPQDRLLVALAGFGDRVRHTGSLARFTCPRLTCARSLTGVLPSSSSPRAMTRRASIATASTKSLS